MNYLELLEKLFERNRSKGMKLGLQNALELDQLLGFPSKKFRSVHIAGSNGKGSVATKIAEGFKASGKRVGLYTSPHISSFRERIRLQGEMISEEAVTRLLNQIFSLDTPATFFEMTTALAFLYFVEEQVEYAVIETGLGGRLDATNILHPELSIITSISLEHTDLLGNTEEEIAFEKAGIIKPGVPVLLGPRAALIQKNHPQAEVISGNFASTIQENNEVAKRAMQLLGLPEKAIEIGLQVSPPCRMERHPRERTVILDVAHNPDGLSRLLAEVQERPLQILCNFSRGKDLKKCLSILKNSTDSITFLEINHPRLMQRAEIEPFYPDALFQKPEEALSSAFEKEGMILVTGSFFIMEQMRQALGLNHPTDALSLQEYR